MPKGGNKKLAKYRLFFVFLFLFSVILNAPVFADEDPPSTSSSMGFSLDFSDSVLQMSLSSNSIHLDLTPGITAFSSGSTTATVSTNNLTGYTLTVTPSSTSLISNATIGNDTPTIPTLSESVAESSFPNDKWGYKLTGNTYYPVTSTISPASWIVEEPTNGTANTITFASKVSNATPSGTYSTTLTFQAVANPNTNKDTITFDKNDANATGSMASQTIYQDGTSKINQNSFQLSGMQFMGWSTTASGTGTGVKYYGDNATYASPNPGQNNNVTLYAQWAPSGTPTSTNPSGVTGTTFARAYEIAYTAAHKGMYEKDESQGGDGKYHLINSWPPDSESYHGYDVRFALQDMTPEICASVTALYDDYQALDIRDDKLYHITKMKNGSCWMTQNLDLNLTHGVELTNQNTDLNNKSTWDPDRDTVTFSGTYVPNWGNDNQSPYSADSQNVFAIPAGTGATLGTLADCQSALSATEEICMHYHTGNYYNYAAAIAENAASSAFNNWQYAQAPNSICPKGWKLPESLKNESKQESSASDYNRLFYYEGVLSEWATSNQQLSITQAQYGKIHGAPIYLAETGYIYGAQLTANVGYYRVAGTVSSVESYYLHYGSTSVVVDEGYTYRYLAEPVRCLAR